MSLGAALSRGCLLHILVVQAVFPHSFCSLQLNSSCLIRMLPQKRKIQVKEKDAAGPRTALGIASL